MMKLTQNIALTSDLNIKTWLSGAPKVECEFSLLKDKIDLSFHPFYIKTWSAAENVVQGHLKEQARLCWQILLVDDEEEKALRRLKSPSRTLLLVSELLNGLLEASSLANFIIESIEPDLSTDSLILSFSFSAHSDYQTIVSDALLIKVTMDSLLFCRGLDIKKSSFSSKSDEAIMHQLKAIFLNTI